MKKKLCFMVIFASVVAYASVEVSQRGVECKQVFTEPTKAITQNSFVQKLFDQVRKIDINGIKDGFATGLIKQFFKHVVVKNLEQYVRSAGSGDVIGGQTKQEYKFFINELLEDQCQRFQPVQGSQEYYSESMARLFLAREFKDFQTMQQILDSSMDDFESFEWDEGRLLNVWKVAKRVGFIGSKAMMRYMGTKKQQGENEFMLSLIIDFVARFIDPSGSRVAYRNRKRVAEFLKAAVRVYRAG